MRILSPLDMVIKKKVFQGASRESRPTLELVTSSLDSRLIGNTTMMDERHEH